MSDGAHQGVNAQRAIETIIGGKAQPKKREKQTRAQVRERLARAPTPDGPSPKDYGDAGDAIAAAFLVVRKEDPTLPLEVDPLWSAVSANWPDFDRWVGGATGFLVGWACNCVRWLAEEQPVANPAILEIVERESK